MSTAPAETGGESAASLISIVIPVGDRLIELGEVLRQYGEELAKRGGRAEFVVVLDGVSDEVFRDAQKARPAGANVRLVRLNHPFGESIALSAGFRITSGGVVVTLPPYLQVDPTDIHRVLDALEDGLDLVVGYRLRRVDPILNRLQSKVFNGVMRLLTGVKLHDLNCPVRAMRRKVLEDVTIQGDMMRFLPIMAHRHGFRVGEAKVRHLRERGRSGFFGIAVYIRRFLDVITLLFLSKFTRAPLRFFGVMGVVSTLLGIGIVAYLAADYLFLGGEPLRNRALLVVGVVLFVLGVQVFAIGLVGEMITFLQAKNLKEYRLYEEQEEAARSQARQSRRKRQRDDEKGEADESVSDERGPRAARSGV
jgi:glycosyltransferase involved in cell wall biosynthesis